MFERFTERARRVVVLAQEEARALSHNYIGTEHLLLGLVREGDSVGAKVIESFGLTLDDLRDDVERLVGQGQAPPTGHVPFTPRAKRCLELCLREALQLGHNYIGTEHILLGLLRAGESEATEVLSGRGISLNAMRASVMTMIGTEASAAVAGGGSTTELSVSGSVAATASARARVTAEALAEEGTYDPKCPNCKRASLVDTAAFKIIEVPEDGGTGAIRMRVVYCEACGVAVNSQILD